MDIKAKTKISEKKSKPARNKHKLDSLNFNLKNEILSFLPVIQVINQILKLSIQFAYALKEIKYFKNFKANLNELLQESTFQKEIMLPIIESFKIDCGVSETCAKQISEYLLNRKIRDNRELKIEQKTTEQEDFLNTPCLSTQLKKNKNITSLVFSEIEIASAEGGKFNSSSFTEKIEKICECLMVNKSIINLDISNCYLGDEPKNFAIMQEMLTKNKTLKALNISLTGIGINPENLKLLVEGLKAN